MSIYQSGTDLMAALVDIGYDVIHYDFEHGLLCVAVEIPSERELFELGHSLAYYHKSVEVSTPEIVHGTNSMIVYFRNARISGAA